MSNLSGLTAVVGANPNPNKSVEVTQPPTDSVSSLSFSPKGNFLVATSWDNQVRCWEILQTGSSVAKAVISHDQPVLCSTWKDDGTTVFSGGCDKQVKMWPLMSGGQPVTVAMHDAPVKELAWVPEMNLLVTGSWDKTLRCVAAFPDQQGFLVGSIEGRVGVHHMDDSQQSKNFTFKCHREGSDIYSVNSLNFHPVHHTFATAGSDGAFNFWDKDSKQRLKAMARCSQPIPCSTFNNDGSIFAYAVCYDWSKGAENHNPAAKPSIFLHTPQESEVKGKPRLGTSGRK
ncbi:hypothetical protein MRB53_034308 [Persea americana]|uniref:Uncharacterized protein n=1 Tax=Persea americana TaxID=3435 RepID=A0ACC2KXQ7_PERAE|nr:hypothetical protein MRB53_034308 [Persea americana]